MSRTLKQKVKGRCLDFLSKGKIEDMKMWEHSPAWERGSWDKSSDRNDSANLSEKKSGDDSAEACLIILNISVNGPDDVMAVVGKHQSQPLQTPNCHDNMGWSGSDVHESRSADYKLGGQRWRNFTFCPYLSTWLVISTPIFIFNLPQSNDCQSGGVDVNVTEVLSNIYVKFTVKIIYLLEQFMFLRCFKQ